MEDGRVMRMDKFIACCKSGELTDLDGCAQFFTGTNVVELSEYIYPSEVKDERIVLTDYNYVIWYSEY